MKATTLLLLLSFALPALAQRTPSIGIATGPENDSLVTVAGYSGITLSAGKWLSPREVSDAQFQQNLVLLAALRTPVYAFNLFLPGDLKVVGPQVDETAVLAYADALMARVAQTDARLIVWGSGGSRRLPDGFERQTAVNQFTTIASKIADLAQKHDLTVVLENLNTSECNFITSVAEALDIVRRVNHPHLRLNADIYHMLKDSEGPEILLQTQKYLYHVEIAEKENRTAPGVEGTDFRPYLRALRQIRYRRMIGIEGRWETLAEVAAPAKTYLAGQIAEVY
ncbi:MAG: sugar phosphate isomerase/epimerase [Bacteroidetes bacterium]|nr:MAG: sugar phosphate isomerase/epimerase [Bacteroidota bacterium]